MPQDPPNDPKRGQLCREGERWWRFTTTDENSVLPKDTWLPHEPTEEDRAEYILQVTVAVAEDMEQISRALEKGMLGEFQKAVNELKREAEPPQGRDLVNGQPTWYETGKGWTGGGLSQTRASYPVTLKVMPHLHELRYYIVAECLKEKINEDSRVVQGYLDDGVLETKAESLKVYGQWMRTVGYQLARYVWHQRAEGEDREIALDAYEQLTERGIVVTRHDWMDNPELTDDVARAIASIKKD